LDIADVFNRYAAALDDKRWDRLAELYTPDATAEHPEGSPPLIGPAAIVAMISSALDWLGPTLLSLTNHVAAICGDHADASCYVRAYHAGRGEHADEFEETLGRFSAKLVRTPNGWRFTHFVERIIAILGTTEIFNPSLLPGK
jgi:ketosteroid isomerase-like protein